MTNGLGQVQVPLGSSIELTFETENSGLSSNRAHQTVAILSSPALGLDISYPASVRVSGKGKVSIAYKNIPEVLMSNSAGPLTLALAVAGFDQEVIDEQPDTEVDVEEDVEVEEDEEETDEETGEVTVKKVKRTVKQTKKGSKPTPALVSVSASEPLLLTITDNLILPSVRHNKPDRFELKPEIKHIFRAPPHQISPLLALPIVFGVMLSLIFIFHALTVFAEVDLEGLIPALKADALHHVGFLLTLGGFEYTFYQYYRGSSIFETLGSFAVIAPSAVYFGSRALREVRDRRLAGKF